VKPRRTSTRLIGTWSRSTSAHALFSSGKVLDQAYRDFVFHPFAITFSSSAEEQYPGFALSALFLFEPAALMSLRHCRLSFVKRMLYGFSNILKPETRGGMTRIQE